MALNKTFKHLSLMAGGSHYPTINPDMQQKFGELILQDIERIIDDLYHVMPLEQAAVLLTLDEQIKEHFYGVE